MVRVFDSAGYCENVWAEYMGLDARNPVFGSLRTTQAQTSLRIHADWSALLLFTYRNVSYLDMLEAKFQFSS